MALPAIEIERPAKNHRNAGERSGRSDPSPVPDADAVALTGGSVSGTSCHAASAPRIHQPGFRTSDGIERPGRRMTAL
jgi:hypothetical protein